MKFKKIALLILSFLLIFSALVSISSCAKKDKDKCPAVFSDADGDGYCDFCKQREAPCTEFGEKHGIIETGNVCKKCKFHLSECLRHEDYLHDDNRCDRCNAYCTKWDEFIGMLKVFKQQFIDYGGYRETLNGLVATIQIAIWGLLIGVLIGTLIAVAKVTPSKRWYMSIFRAICDIYVGFFRGTPMMVQLLMTKFALLPTFRIEVDSITVAIIIFGMNSGAYVSEIMRAGINSVDRGQLEAGRAVGLPYGTAMLKIVIPQSIKNILPTLGNEFIVLIKETSLVSFVAVVDITKALQNIASATYEPMIPYLVLAVIYLVLVVGITFAVKALERRMRRSERS